MVESSKELTWQQFQSELAELFRVAGYDVTEDVLLGHKKVDLLISERRLGKNSRIAVECKNWSSKITQKVVSEIYANYLPLIPAHVDEILIVSKVGVAESAKAMIANTPSLRAASLSEIHTSIMDFRMYIRETIDQYTEDGLSEYYVHPLTSDREDLYSQVTSWMGSDDTQPLALLGGYGIGKTTFARRLAHDLAVRADQDPSSRIPVLVRLGEISTEQSVEGLLGKLFTATSLVRNYSFSGLIQLNRLGRLVIILDGFDEMKQSLTWQSFKYNFGQLNRLVMPRSKVLLLGRPTAFLTDAEHAYALHGIMQRESKIYRDPNWPDYKEIELAGFSAPQVAEFLSAYLKYLATSAKTETERKRYDGFAVDVAELMSGNLADIVRRPVQLKMLAEVLPDYRGKKLDVITVHDLYDYFIDFVTDREATKPERGRFRPDQLRTFAREVAIWLWRQRSQRVMPSLIPSEMIEKYKSPSDDSETTMRDLVVSSLLDRRPGIPFYFPHRSFQEFLVAEAVFLGVADHTLDFAELDGILTPQVAEFLAGFASEKYLASVASGLERYRGPIPLSFISVILVGGDPLKYYPNQSLWGLLLAAVGFKLGKVNLREVRERLREVQTTTRDPQLFLFTIYVSLVAARFWRNPSEEEPSRLVADTILGAISFLSTTYSRRANTVGDGVFHLGELLELIRGLTFVDRSERGALQIGPAYRRLHQACKDLCYISDWTDGRQLMFREAGLPEKVTDVGDRVRVAIGDLLDLRSRVAAPKRPRPELPPIRRAPTKRR